MKNKNSRCDTTAPRPPGCVYFTYFPIYLSKIGYYYNTIYCTIEIFFQRRRTSNGAATPGTSEATGQPCTISASSSLAFTVRRFCRVYFVGEHDGPSFGWNDAPR